MKTILSLKMVRGKNFQLGLNAFESNIKTFWKELEIEGISVM